MWKNKNNRFSSAFFQEKNIKLPKNRKSMVAYFGHHLSDDYVDLSDLYVVLSDLYVELSDLYVDLSLIHLSGNKSYRRVLAWLMSYI